MSEGKRGEYRQGERGDGSASVSLSWVSRRTRTDRKVPRTDCWHRGWGGGEKGGVVSELLLGRQAKALKGCVGWFGWRTEISVVLALSLLFPFVAPSFLCCLRRAAGALSLVIMWQVGVVFAALASFSGAVGDALVRLSFVVEEKRVRKARRQQKQAQQRKRARELKRSSFASQASTQGDCEGSESTRSNFGGRASSEWDDGRERGQLSCASKTGASRSGAGSGWRSSPQRLQPAASQDADGRSVSARRRSRRRGSRERDEDACGVRIRKRPLYLRPLWVLGTCFGTAINSLLSIISLDFASAAVVTPFAGLHIFWNVILSRFVLQVRRSRDLQDTVRIPWFFF